MDSAPPREIEILDRLAQLQWDILEKKKVIRMLKKELFDIRVKIVEHRPALSLKVAAHGM